MRPRWSNCQFNTCENVAAAATGAGKHCSLSPPALPRGQRRRKAKLDYHLARGGKRQVLCVCVKDRSDGPKPDERVSRPAGRISRPRRRTTSDEYQFRRHTRSGCAHALMAVRPADLVLSLAARDEIMTFGLSSSSSSLPVPRPPPLSRWLHPQANSAIEPRLEVCRSRRSDELNYHFYLSG